MKSVAANIFTLSHSSKRNNIKKHWDAVNLILHKKIPNLCPTSISNKNKLITNPNQIAKIINKYYVNVAPGLVKKLPKSASNKHFSSYPKIP